MANLRFSNTLRNNILDEITGYAGSAAILKLFAGTQPAGGGAETTVLAVLNMASPFASAASGGQLVVGAITADASADASGVATWWRIYQSDGTTWVMDGDISTIAANTGDMLMDDTSIVINGTVTMGGPNLFSAGNAP